MSYYFNHYVEFAYSKIRKRGSLLKTSGGKAPGHLPLKRALHKVKKVLDAAGGRRLKPIEVYDICMFFAKEAVLSGGIRRSATIFLFSPEDEEMMTAKIPQNYSPSSGINPQRSASNNSAVLIRSKAERGDYDKLFHSMLEMGEPGFFFSENIEHGTNPCVEIGLYPVIDVDSSNIEDLRLRLDKYILDHGEFTCNGIPVDDVEHGDRIYTWQFCNLTTMSGAKIKTKEDFFEACKATALIGTLQADYTNTPYIGPFAQYINEREALLGVSICGIMDSPHVLLNPDILEEGARIVRETNVRVANIIGINPAARTTCVKPEGTASLVMMCASGITPHPSRRFFRRVQANKTESVLQFFKSSNPLMVEDSVWNPGLDEIICFCVEVDENAIVLSDLNGIQFLDIVNLVQKHWVLPGNTSEDYAPGLRHNVSNTVAFSRSEKDAVADWIWNHRHEVTGISLLMDAGVYPQAPREPVVSDIQAARWNSMNCKNVDYTLMVEEQDGTMLKENIACAGGQCEL
jgi:ribonucleoside-diphosphate reductase alpha chain